ncbi:hypothetical protein RIF29_34857 [Crotalaria pallida]|uniref:Uncharacterized protein n=1 Tax=Crotalaria pallida TaxID=3830 RepID=A0AAN9HXL9_CROPI
MATHKLALIIQNPSNHSEFLLVKQTRPPKFDHEEYDSFVDSDLWDLPSVQLNPLEQQSDQIDVTMMMETGHTVTDRDNSRQQDNSRQWWIEAVKEENWVEVEKP